MSQINNQRFYSLWIGLSLVLFIGCGLYFQLFNQFDRLIYDKITTHSYLYKPNPSQILLVELDADYEGLSVNQWFSLLEQIQQYQPAAIAINLLPWNWSDKNIKQATQRFPLSIGSTETQKISTNNKLFYSAVPPLDGSVYRQQHHKVTLGNKTYLALESIISRELKKNNPNEITAQDYFVNFMGGSARLPTLSSQRVLEGGLVEGLVKDKVILIGVQVPMMLDLPSPLGMMSYANYQAYALDTLLNNNPIEIADNGLVLLLAVLLILLLFFSTLKVPDSYQLPLFIIVIISTVVISYFMLIMFHYWILVGYLLITEFIILIALVFLRNRQNQKALQGMAISSAAKIETHWLSEDFFSSKAQWNHIANMVSQTLSLERMIFLERVENDHRVREIKALNCSLNDVGEMRRDYQRTPYTTAIEHDGALKLNRPYLEGTTDDEVQYLMPLSFAGNIQGFWAFTIKHDAQIDESKLVKTVEQFAMQISELLYHWSEWGRSQKNQSKFVTSFLQMKFEKHSYDSINHSINFLTNRISVMESVMDGLETLAILFDLFGRVVHVNKSMTHMLTDINLMPYSMTTVDLIVNLTSCNMTEAKNHLSHIILEQGSINLPIINDGVKTGYVMVISALKKDALIEEAESEIVPFEIIGVLCELIDMSHIQEMYSQKEKIVQYMSGHLKNDLSSISMACDLVLDKRMATDKHAQLIQLIKKKVIDMTENFQQVNSIVQQDLVTKANVQYPVGYVDLIQTAISDSLRQQNKSIKIEPVIPFFSPLVMASPKELRKTFTAIFNILISDAIEDSEITVNINCDNNKIIFVFKNTGFGIPQEQLQQYIESREKLISDEFENLRIAYNQIINWDENFTAKSKIGDGMEIEFSLKAFLL